MQIGEKQEECLPLEEMRSPRPYMWDRAGAHELISRYCSLKMRRCPVVFQMGSWRGWIPVLMISKLKGSSCCLYRYLYGSLASPASA